MAGFDFDMFNSLDHDLSTEEYELVEFDQPSVDELVSFINGSGGGGRPISLPLGKSSSMAGSKKECHVHASVVADVDSASKKKKNKKKKKRKAGATAAPDQSAAHVAASPSSTAPASTASDAPDRSAGDGSVASAAKGKESSSPDATGGCSRDDEDDESEDAESSDDVSSTTSSSADPPIPRDLQEKMRLARQNPSAIFCESQFEEDDEETQEQIELFRLALESAHLDSSKRAKLKPRVKFAPQDVFRSSTLAASQRQSSQYVSTAI